MIRVDQEPDARALISQKEPCIMARDYISSKDNGKLTGVDGKVHQFTVDRQAKSPGERK